MKRPALEAAFDRACGDAPEYCQVCRAPLSETRGYGGVELFDGEQLGTCSACGREVDPLGLTTLVCGPSGTFRRAVFRFRQERDHTRKGWPS